MKDIELFRHKFFTSPNVTVIPTIEGNRFLYKGYVVNEYGISDYWDGNSFTLAFGARAGTFLDINLTNLAHEMAHFVEIDEARCSMDGWGLKSPTSLVMGLECIKPHTMQATARECRVIAHQSNLLEALGFSVDVHMLANGLQVMYDCCHVPNVNESKYQESNVFRIQYCARYINELRTKPEYSFENFKQVWFERIEKLPTMWNCESAN